MVHAATLTIRSVVSVLIHELLWLVQLLCIWLSIQTLVVVVIDDVMVFFFSMLRHVCHMMLDRVHRSSLSVEINHSRVLFFMVMIVFFMMMIMLVIIIGSWLINRTDIVLLHLRNRRSLMVNWLFLLHVLEWLRSMVLRHVVMVVLLFNCHCQGLPLK